MADSRTRALCVLEMYQKVLFKSGQACGLRGDNSVCTCRCHRLKQVSYTPILRGSQTTSNSPITNTTTDQAKWGPSHCFDSSYT
jgi:hypothetical protein